MSALTRTLRGLAVALAVALVGLVPADAEPGRAGIVTALHGTATVTRASLPVPRSLRFRDDVMLQDRIATGDESLARILLGGKAVVTVRERSVVTITESPSVSTVDLASGKIALSVAKERMRPGQSIQIRTPNAVAGIRGTVVIAEVARTAADVTTRFTLLTGIIDVVQIDGAGQAIGAAAVLNPLQTISVDATLSPVRSITRDEGKAASAEFRLPVKAHARGGPDWVAKDHVQQAVAIVEPDRGRGTDPRPESRPDKGGNSGGKADKPDRADKPDKVDKPNKPDKLDRIDKTGPPITPPSIPIVPSYTLQPTTGKDKKDKNR